MLSADVERAAGVLLEAAVELVDRRGVMDAAVDVADCFGPHKPSKSIICPSAASMKQTISGLTFCARRGEGAATASDRKRAARRIFLFSVRDFCFA